MSNLNNNCLKFKILQSQLEKSLNKQLFAKNDDFSMLKSTDMIYQMHDKTNFDRVCQNRMNKFIAIFRKIEFDDESSLSSIHRRFVICFVFFESLFQIMRACENDFIIIKLIEIERNNCMT